VAWWDPRVEKENMETAGANYVSGMEIFLLHPSNCIYGIKFTPSAGVALILSPHRFAAIAPWTENMAVPREGSQWWRTVRDTVRNLGGGSWRGPVTERSRGGPRGDRHVRGRKIKQKRRRRRRWRGSADTS
jgi:hypothetical protein